MHRLWWFVLGAFLGLLIIYGIFNRSPISFLAGDEVIVLNVTTAASPLPCTMSYGDQLAVSAGRASTPAEAVAKTKAKLKEIGRLYESLASGGDYLGYPIGWGGRIYVRRRGPAEKYSRSGWYIAAQASDGSAAGEFYLSDDGQLMPAKRTCTRIDCCI
jgi:hypothetical protein